MFTDKVFINYMTQAKPGLGLGPIVLTCIFEASYYDKPSNLSDFFWQYTYELTTAFNTEYLFRTVYVLCDFWVVGLMILKVILVVYNQKIADCRALSSH